MGEDLAKLRAEVIMELALKYGCNPHQGQATLTFSGKSPLQILNGTPGYINLLDALNSWQLVRDLKVATGIASAASFKHVSPAGAAIAKPIKAEYLRSQFLELQDYSEVACAYIRARGGDRMCSYGDVLAVSDRVDVSLANVLKREVSDLIIAPSYDPQALEILKTKQKGRFIILQMDWDYDPVELEQRQVFGFTLSQQRNRAKVDASLFQNIVSRNRAVAAGIIETLTVATIALKYTQSNSVCIAYDGQVIGMGAGQQSRVHCTRLACGKADKWFLQQHPAILGLSFQDKVSKTDKTNAVDQILLWNELSEPEKAHLASAISGAAPQLSPEDRLKWIHGFDGICLSSDAFIPFRDNIDRASRSHVQYVAHAGQALRDDNVTAAADEYGMVMFQTGLRLFTH
ncbi:MAG TPA: phosphoribosylaminoimidazolecarboxamide formyltransferase [Fibrobacteraceae bacterium]|nr:phosphoribosylaminoimidazolecarboxamide formyltransferase [Fibrobacteraceae bacterium]